MLSQRNAADEGRTPRFYSVPDAAELLGLSEPTLYRAIRAGEFPAVKVRGRYVIPAKAIDAMEAGAMELGLIDAAEYTVTRSVA